jgi:ATP-dependent Clp protease ATP-binding subunit ClpA
MFELDQAIAEWRQRMIAGGIKSPVPLEELESHLREDVQNQIRSGATPERAFIAATKQMGVRRELVRAEIEKIVGAGSQCGNVQALPYTPRVKKSLDLAAREAKILKRPQIGAEHIFLGLVIEGSGVAGLVLKRLGVDAGKACGEIMKELSGQKDINE